MSINNLFNISLIDTLLPSPESFEGRELAAATTLDPCSFNAKRSYLESLRIAELFLKILKESVGAVNSGSYKQFDALIKNFGCQITALEVYRLAESPDLKERASRLRGPIDSRLKKIEKIKSNFENELKNSPFKAERHTFRGVVDHYGLDLAIDETFARLVRFRLLAAINTNVDVEGEEVPRSNPDLLRSRKFVPKLDSKSCHSLVNGLQAEESQLAAKFIQEVSLSLPPVLERSRLVVNALSDENLRVSKVAGGRSYSPIASLPLLYNTEASLGGIGRGLIAVKNKVDFIGKRIEGARDLCFFVDAETKSLLREEEVRSHLCSRPVVVVEGYIRDGERLRGELREGRLIDIINANCALLEQYASKTDQGELADEELQRDLSEIAARAQPIVKEIFAVDHIYCASLKELGFREEAQ